MSNVRQQFARRLADAMKAKGYEPKPGVLHKLSNSRYQGASVGFSTPSKWLRGVMLPDDEKVLVLADLFGVDPHELRYGRSGKASRYQIAEDKLPWQSLGAYELQVINGFLALPARQQELVGALVAELTDKNKGNRA